jgi:uncharacterized membrane-anchored protein
MKKTDNLFMIILGSVIVLGFFGLVALLLTFEVKEANQNILYLVAGGLMAAFGSVVNYYFGSSHGSKIKTEDMIAKSNAADKVVSEINCNDNFEALG